MRDAGRLAHAVALVDRDPEGREELEGAQRDGRRTGRRGEQSIEAEGVLDLGDDQLVGELAGQRAGLLALRDVALERLELGAKRPGRELRLDAGRGPELGLERGLKLLPDAGDPEKQSGTHLGEIVLELRELGAEEDFAATAKVHEVGEQLLGDVAQRQVADRAVRLGVAKGREVLEDSVRDHDHAAVLQHHGLRHTGGAGRVDEQGGLVIRHLVEAAIEVRVALIAAERTKRIERRHPLVIVGDRVHGDDLLDGEETRRSGSGSTCRAAPGCRRWQSSRASASRCTRSARRCSWCRSAPGMPRAAMMPN